MENALRRKSSVYQRPDYSAATAPTANGSPGRVSLREEVATRGCHDKKLSGCRFTSFFLLGLLTASYIRFWPGALEQAADLLITLKMSKCCFSCCCLFSPLWLLVTKLTRAPTTIRLPEIMEHRKCSWFYETSGNTEEETKILLI